MENSSVWWKKRASSECKNYDGGFHCVAREPVVTRSVLLFMDSQIFQYYFAFTKDWQYNVKNKMLLIVLFYKSVAVETYKK